MTIRSMILAAATVGALLAPISAMADPIYGHQDERRETWRGDDRGGRDWRDHDRREHESRGERNWRPIPAYYHRPACWYENRSFRNYWGRWEVRSVRVCR